MAKHSSDRLEVWQCRREFFQAAQRKVPIIGRYLRRYGMPAYDNKVRTQVIRTWQARFNLPDQWAFECAWATLAMWDRYPETRQPIQWFAAPRSHNLAEEGLPTFEFRIERHFYPGLDFGWFKQSVHGALEMELERFRESIGSQDLGSRRQPRNLGRAFECLALRVCQGQNPGQISSRREYRRDWTTLFRDLKSAAELIGLRLARRGRPAKKIAR